MIFIYTIYIITIYIITLLHVYYFLYLLFFL